MSDPDSIKRADELLELLYWLEGEGFGEETSPARLARFVGSEERETRETLVRLGGHGLVEELGNGHWSLTPTGRQEAGRRFVAEFAPLLRQGHGACHDPDCDCMTNPQAECHGDHF
jgi:hypothetical protein